MDRTDDGRPIKMLTLIDEHTNEAPAICPARRITANDVIGIFADVMVERGVPEFICSDNGPEMVAKTLRNWLARVGAKTLYIAPGSPRENGYNESFNGSSGTSYERRNLLHLARVLIEASALQPGAPAQCARQSRLS